MIITVGNNKGGVSKTTTAVNMATTVASQGSKVLLVDTDGQGNGTRSFGIQERSYRVGLYNLLIDNIRIMMGEKKKFNTHEAIIRTEYGVDVLPCDHRVSEIPSWLLENADNFRSGSDILYYWRNKFPFFLKNIIEEIKMNYKWIIFDTPPAFEYMTKGALIASEYVIIPVELGDLEITGLENFLAQLIRFKRSNNDELSILGILISRYSAQSNVEKDLEASLRNDPALGPFVFETVIHRNVGVKEASVNLMPATEHKRKGIRSARENFKELIKEAEAWARIRKR